MRSLKATDIFAMARLVNAIGIKEEVKTIAMKANKLSDITVEEQGFDLLFGIFEKATEKKAEAKFFEFFSGIFEKPVKELENMDPVDFLNGVLEAANVEKWKAFFSAVARLMK